MVRLRTATGNIGWCEVHEKDAAAMVASGKWLRADSLDYSRSKFGEVLAPEAEVPVAPAVEAPAKRGPGRPKKVAE